MTATVSVTADQLRSALTFEDLIEPMSAAFAASSAGRAASTSMLVHPLADHHAADVLVKAGVVTDRAVFVVKVAPWFAANVAAGRPQGGFVAVLDSGNGHAIALVHDEHLLSDLRTAAAGALAARVLAPPEVHAATVLGAGVQAYWQCLALFGERPFERLTIWARNRARAQVLCERLRVQLPAVAIDTSDDHRSACADAQVIITTTSSRMPLVSGDMLRPGQHVTAVGADEPDKCEIDASALRRARVFVDDRAAGSGAGNVHRAIELGGYRPGELAGEIGDVINGTVAGRSSPTDITIATFVGIGAQDVVAAELALQRLGILPA
jgi:ornithine cyclodeaminase